ncbi:MAG: Rpn family recombination-promoting nuclease/putative transposase [Eubacteriales bacterium]
MVSKGKATDGISKDVTLKEFWRDGYRFADLFNGTLFGGEHVLSADILSEMDTDQSTNMEYSNYSESIIKTRDVIKKSAFGTQFVIMGIENQMEVHYAMPLRTIVYDTQGYVKEAKEIGKKRAKEEIKETAAEFLSRFGKEDKLTPIITIVIYYGKKEWDGPIYLTDMMLDLPDQVKPYVCNYQMNLVQVLNAETNVFTNQDVKLLFEYSQAFMNKNVKQIQLLSNQYHVSKEVAQAIGAVTSTKSLGNNLKSESEELDMCEYFEELVEKGKVEGRVISIKNLMESMNWTMIQAMDALKIVADEREECLKMLENV